MANPPPLPLPSTGLPTPPPVDASTFIWLFFRLDGRVGREVYWLSILLLSALVGLTGPFTIDPATGQVTLLMNPLQSVFSTLATYCYIAVSVKRLHDLNMTGFFALGLLFFLISVILTIWLGVRQADPAPNRFGWQSDVRPTVPPPPDPNEDEA